MLPPLQNGLASYLASVTGTEGQGKLLLSRQGCWEWGVDLPAAATLLQGLTLAADLKLPTGLALLPPSFKADLPQRWVCVLGASVACCAAGRTLCSYIHISFYSCIVKQWLLHWWLTG